MCLAENLKKLRLQRGLSLADVADLLGYKSLTTISKWESGTNEPPFGVVKKLSDYYGVSMQTLATANLELDKPSGKAIELSLFEKSLIEAYRDADELTKKMVHRNLGLDEEFEKENLRKNFA